MKLFFIDAASGLPMREPIRGYRQFHDGVLIAVKPPRAFATNWAGSGEPAGCAIPGMLACKPLARCGRMPASHILCTCTRNSSG
jgi:hypothetical protein